MSVRKISTVGKTEASDKLLAFLFDAERGLHFKLSPQMGSSVSQKNSASRPPSKKYSDLFFLKKDSDPFFF
jgi:hypothetical protein